MSNQGQRRPHYVIEFYIGDLELTAFLANVTLISSWSSVYHLFIINMNIDAKDYIMERLYGQEDIRINIKLKTTQETSIEENEIELISLNPLIDLSQKSNTQEPENPLRDRLSILAIPKLPFNSMTTPVNTTLRKGDGDDTRPLDVVEELLDDFNITENTEIIRSNENEFEPNNIIIPSMSFSKSLRYLNQEFGLYSGPYFSFCHYDNNTFQLWDISKKIKEQEEYEVFFLKDGQPIGIAEENTSDDDISEYLPLEDKYFTYAPIRTYNTTNSSLLRSGYNHKFITKPNNKLYEIKNYEAEEVFKENSPTYENQRFYLNENFKKIMNIYNRDSSIYTENESQMKSGIASYFSNLSKISFVIDYYVPLKKMSRVGIPIKLTPRVEEYLPYKGNYIVGSTMITFSRDSQQLWWANTEIRAFRGNIEN